MRQACLGRSILPFPEGAVGGSTLLDEIAEIIALPEFNVRVVHREEQANREVVLPANVISELRDYVTCISTMYHSNAFHNFEHASHVAMSVAKLLSRIVAPDLDEFLEDVDEEELFGKRKGSLRGGSNFTKLVALNLHDHTYGITSDPLTQFSCIFSALIHDVDHSGVPNAQLVKENVDIAKIYKNRSVAEQNSFDLSWGLLFDDRFDHLRSAIYSTNDEQQRFRQLVINSVMATDISDKELKKLRNNRWEKAFKSFEGQSGMDKSTTRSRAAIRDDINRKATIVIEHLIQASDVSHTMQHWHIYRK